MPKYLMIWEVDSSRIPTDPKERGAMWVMFAEMVKQNIAAGKTIDWGAFVGEDKGYAISERSEIGLGKDVQAMYPYVKFKVHQVMSVDDVVEVAKSMMG